MGTIFNLQGFTIFSVYLYLITLLFYKKKNKILFKSTSQLFIILTIGIVYAYTNLPRDIIRDIFYFLNPIILLVFGAACSKRIKFSKFISKITFFGFLYSIFYIASFFYYIFQDSYSIDELRGLIGPGNILTIISFFLLLFNKNESKIFQNSNIRYILMFINLFALFLFNSRSYFLCFIIIFLFLFKYFKSYAKLNLLIVFVLFIFSFSSFNFTTNNSFNDKILNSINEISINNGSDLNTDNSNYRAYETFSAFETYLSGNNFNYLIGQGFGKLVDLKFEIQLTEDSWQYIPLVHNGYMYILVKSGLLGLFLFLHFMFQFYKSNKSLKYNLQNRFPHSLLKSLIVCCIFTTFVINGFFNLEMQFLLITIGALRNYLDNNVKITSSLIYK